MKLRQLLFAAIFTALTALGALFLKVPLPGTPLVITLQTFFVFMSGLLLEARYALFSQLAYAAIGLLGLPVFSGGGGISYALQPSFGFIIGFCVCAPLVSVIVRNNLLKVVSLNENRLMPMLKASTGALASVAVLYTFGVIYMYMIYYLYLGQPKTLGTVIVAGAGVFIFIDIIKFALAIPLCLAILKRIRKYT